MKKYIAILFALLLMSMVGCSKDEGKDWDVGPSASQPTQDVQSSEPEKVSDHVVDYTVDVPESFEPMEMEGLAACWYNTADNSNINVNIMDKDATTDLGFKAITAEMLRLTLVSSFKEAYGVEPEITDRYFTNDQVCGLEAYQYSYTMILEGQEMTQLIVCVNADKTYTFTYTDATGEWIDTFEESAKNIQFTMG